MGLNVFNLVLCVLLCAPCYWIRGLQGGPDGSECNQSGAV